MATHKALDGGAHHRARSPWSPKVGHIAAAASHRPQWQHRFAAHRTQPQAERNREARSLQAAAVLTKLEASVREAGLVLAISAVHEQMALQAQLCFRAGNRMHAESIEVMLMAAGAYLACGAVFVFIYWLVLLPRRDTAARDMTVLSRLLTAPGIIALWPLLLFTAPRSARSPLARGKGEAQ
jgi:hypothetical protein